MDREKFEQLKSKALTGYNRAMGMELLEAEETGLCVMRMAIGPDQMNPIGTIHGGAVFSLADTAGGLAVWAMGDTMCTTCTSTVDYFNPTAGADSLTARAQVLKHGKRMSTVEVTLYTNGEQPVAKVLSRFYHLEMKYR